jgi:hypothetical protein
MDRLVLTDAQWAKTGKDNRRFVEAVPWIHNRVTTPKNDFRCHQSGRRAGAAA